MALDVCVLGSINMDVILKIKSFPHPGETVMATSVARSPGGKGANQAVAAARAGASVALSGTVGADENGTALLALLKAEAIDCAAVSIHPAHETGTAVILIDEWCENEIVVASSANMSACAPTSCAARVYLSQLEIPLEAVDSFVRNRPGDAIAMLNAAPYRSDALPLLAEADLVVVNESELAGYCDGPVPRSSREAASMARSLLRLGQTITVTLGAVGSVTVGNDMEEFYPAVGANVQDTTGAGDCFCGYLAARLARGVGLHDALAEAHRAAAISVSRLGAIPSIPRFDELTEAR